MTDSAITNLLEEGLALHRRGAVAAAAELYGQVLQADPANADAHYYLAMMSCQAGRFAEGAERARQSLANDPNHARAHVLLGRTLAALGQRTQALASFDQAIALAPDLAQAYGHRAEVLSQLGRNVESIASYDRAVTLAPDSVEDWFNRGAVLVSLGRYGDAVASFDRAITLKPDLAQSNIVRVPRLLSKLRICDWTDLDAEFAQLLAMIEAETPLSVPFAAVAIPASAADQLKSARCYVAAQPVVPQVWRGEIYSHDRIRVAYLSADFREHPTSYLAAGLFERHDRARFEITAISFGPDDKSPIRRRLEGAFERFINVENQSDLEIADLMRRLEIDVAVDLMGFTKDARSSVMARRAAPIQVNYLGYPGTMGASYIDYILADPVVIPEQQAEFYTEQVVWLPETYQINDDKRAIADRTPTRQECGLPPEAFVFCCFNNTQKLMPDVFYVWMQLLRATQDSVLWLLEGNPKASENLRRAVERHGVASQRLIFAPKLSLPEHLSRQRQADLFLDTLPYNAHTTASDALWAGLPVLTCLGSTFAGRVAASLLTAVGLDELITTSLSEYEMLARRIAEDRMFLTSIRTKLAHNRGTSPLFDTQRATRHIESAYHAMVDIWRRGERPRGIHVKAM
jgi:protein O-GlcNAc transferase